LPHFLGCNYEIMCSLCRMGTPDFGNGRLQKNVATKRQLVAANEVRYAKGFSIVQHTGYMVVRVTNPWPNASQQFTYVLQNKNGRVPDSLRKFPVIPVPIKSIVVTSTTHIPSLEMLGVEKTLVGFPNLKYISSEKVRNLIAKGAIKELGSNKSLNTEVLLNLQPDVIVGYGIDNNNPTLDNLEKSGLKVVVNGDWNEETPLGKAEWLKFFGALYGQLDRATALFNTIAKDYENTVQIAKRANKTPTILLGDVFEDKWYLPKGSSWGCQLLKEAQGKYLWADTKGTGSLALSFETVLEKGQNAAVWITSGQYNSLAAMLASNPHYSQFAAFKNKRVYSFCIKKEKQAAFYIMNWHPTDPMLF